MALKSDHSFGNFERVGLNFRGGEGRGRPNEKAENRIHGSNHTRTTRPVIVLRESVHAQGILQGMAPARIPLMVPFPSMHPLLYDAPVSIAQRM